MRFPGNPDKKVKNVARRENRREKREREEGRVFHTQEGSPEEDYAQMQQNYTH